MVSDYRIVEKLDVRWSAQAKAKRINRRRNSSKYLAAKSYSEAFSELVFPEERPEGIAKRISRLGVAPKEAVGFRLRALRAIGHGERHAAHNFLKCSG
jgi:hypothetical protein